MAEHTLPEDVHGRRITDRGLKRGLRVSVLAGALGVAWWTMVQGMPLKMLMEALGASGVLIGLVTMIMQVSLVAQLPGAFIAKGLGSRKKLWGATVLTARALWFIPVLLLALLGGRPRAIAWAVLGVVAASSLLNQSVTALWFSWMADLIPDRIRGTFWGRRQSWVMLASLIAVAVSGRILDLFPPARQGGGSWLGFQVVFAAGALMGCVDIIVHLWVPEPALRARKPAGSWLEHVVDPLRDRDFRQLTIAMGIFTFSVGMVSLGIIYLKKEFNVTYTHLSAISIASSLGVLVSGFGWGYVLDRIGGRAFGAIMLAMIPFSSSVWFFVKDHQTDIVGLVEHVWILGPVVRGLVAALPGGLEAAVRGCVMPQAMWLLLIACFVAGTFYSGVSLSQLSLSSALLPEKGRTMAMAVHWSTVGLIGAMGAVVGGRVMDFFTAHPIDYVLPTGARLGWHQLLVMVHICIMWFVVLPLMLGVRRRHGEPAVKDAFARLLTTNPVRVVTNIYMLSSAVSRRQRARAAQRLGEKRTAIAVSDLIEKLEDASLDVREQSTFALGTIGSADAIDALIEKLDDPNSDLAPQIARALRCSRNTRGVSALMRRLRDPDRETRTESARTLGEIGDRRAVPSLLEMLAEEEDAKVISSSSEALSRLGELAAIYEILPRMKATQNPVLKRSLAVAIGDLLGEPEGFYKVLAKEQQTQGSEVARMLKGLRRSIRNATRQKMTDEGEVLLAKTRAVEALYDDGKLAACFEILFELVIGLAALAWGVKYGGNSKALVNELIWRDERFGIGVWCLDLMRQKWPSVEEPKVDEVDLLLGIYFLSCRAFP